MRFRILCCTAMVAAILLLTPAVASARRLPANPLRLDLEPGAWLHAGLEGGAAYGTGFGSMALGGRMSVGPWLALRGSLAGSYGSFVGVESPWRLHRAWLGPELFVAWNLDGAHLRLGASLEGGTPAVGDGDDFRLTLLDTSHQREDESGLRARAGARVDGSTGAVQLEVVRAGAAASLGGLLDVGDSDRYQRPDPSRPDSTTFLLGEALWRLDARHMLVLDTIWDSEDVWQFGAHYWASWWGDALAPHTWIGVRIVKGHDVFALGLSILHER